MKNYKTMEFDMSNFIIDKVKEIKLNYLICPNCGYRNTLKNKKDICPICGKNLKCIVFTEL